MTDADVPTSSKHGVNPTQPVRRDATEPVRRDATEPVRRAAESRGHTIEILGPHSVRIHGRFSEPTFAALEVMLESSAPMGVWAEGVDGGPSALCLWTGPDFYAITLGVGGKWEHFRPDQGLSLLRDSWRASRARFRVPHGALMQSLPEAVELAQAWGFETPTTSRAIPPPPAPSAAAGRSTAGSAPTRSPRAPRAPRPAATTSSRAAKPEPVLRFCPTCFTALPATGVCDFCA